MSMFREKQFIGHETNDSFSFFFETFVLETLALILLFAQMKAPSFDLYQKLDVCAYLVRFKCLAAAVCTVRIR